MERLADALLVALGMLTIASYSGLLFLGAKPEWALVIVLAGALALGILLNSALSILHEAPHETSTETEAAFAGGTSAAVSPPSPVGEHA
jgi:membrane protein implicated in regulation of membrane protease activity